LSLLYLGSNIEGFQLSTPFAFSETVLSLLLAAILISYLPTMYSAYSRREQDVTGLETQAGSPASPVVLLIRYHKIQGVGQIGEMWVPWRQWFEIVEETHSALLPLVFY